MSERQTQTEDARAPAGAGPLTEMICFDLYAASRSLIAAYRPLLEPLGLTYPQYLVMVVLWRQGPSTVRDLVEALRLHLDASRGVGWLFALADRQVGAAIVAIHREPARRWSVATLAAEVGMSRSGFAARFRQLSGDGPIAYLTRWRMLLAGRRLARGDPIGVVGRSLGYESESAFSTSFKRVTGDTPRRHASNAHRTAKDGMDQAI